MQLLNSAHNFFYLVKNTSSQSKTCIYVNKCLRLNQWVIETAESDICLIKILTCNTDDKMQTLQLINIYNSCSLFSTFIKRSSIISRLSKLLKDNCKQLIMKDFNLHHFHWEKQRCFTQHAAINSLLDIVTNAKLKLLLKSDTITYKTHN